MYVDMLALNLKGLPEALGREILQPALHEVTKDDLDLTENPGEREETCRHTPETSYLNEEWF